jgi:hypothetical protein
MMRDKSDVLHGSLALMVLNWERVSDILNRFLKPSRESL